MTTIEIDGEDFLIDGQPTYAGRTWNGHRVEGLLLNSRMIQATFNDRNPETVGRWAYPDGSPYDPERQTAEFIAALPGYREHGLTAVTLNLQGGSPEGYSKEQPWHNSAFNADGSFQEADLDRMRRCIEACDDNGMAVILGIFYFGQDQRLIDEKAVLAALDLAVEWVLESGWRNVIIEVCNECNVRYTHPVLQAERVHEMIARVKEIKKDGRRLLVGVSYGGGTVPGAEVIEVSDFSLVHGNGVSDPARIAEMVDQTRSLPTWRPMPIVNNEDDHFDFDKPMNNFIAALSRHASWGYFDPGRNSNYRDGFQSPPTNWAIDSTPRKRDFFDLLRSITDGK